jgi:hypothetical protein
VSAEAKSRAQARLKEMGVDPDTKTSHKAKEDSKTTDEAQPHDLRHEEVRGYEVPEEHRILGGYKATLKSSVLCCDLFIYTDLNKYFFTNYQIPTYRRKLKSMQRRC